MLASDDANPQFAGARNPDSLLYVTFYRKVLQDNYRSEKEGRPIHIEEEWVTIVPPGNNLLKIDTPVREEHKRRFPIQWAQFQNSNSSTPISGTPLTEWPAIDRARAEDLKALRFYTVEQIAECSDQQLQSLGMDANTLRVKARAFLESAKGSALAQAQAAEIEKLRAENEAKEKAHAAEMAELRKMIEEMQDKPRRGRPPKTEEVNG